MIMTNEEFAKQTALNCGNSDEVYRTSIVTAQWKDEQAKKLYNCANCKYSEMGDRDGTEICYYCRVHFAHCTKHDTYNGWCDKCDDWAPDE